MKLNSLTRLIQCGLLTGLASWAGAATTNWVAYNDHARGTGTGANVSAYSTSGTTSPQTQGGVLTNYLTGSTLPVSVTIHLIGQIGGSTGGSAAPVAGTPLDQIFSGKVDWANSALYCGGGDYLGAVRYTFTGLDPSKKYAFAGAAVRGNNYAGRWELVTISNAISAIPAHIKGTGTPASPGIVTNGWAPYGNMLAAGTQAAYDAGENRAGDVIAWDEIVPNGDSFTIICTNYRAVSTTAPNNTGGTATLENTYAYAFGAFMLAEIETAFTPVTIVTPPAPLTVEQGRPATLSVVAGGTAPQFEWFKDGVLIPGQTTRTLTFSSAQPSDTGLYYVRVYNSSSETNSPAVQLTVNADTVAPAIVKCVGTPEYDPTTGAETGNFVYTVTFSEAMDVGTIGNAAHYEISLADGSITWQPSEALALNSTTAELKAGPPFGEGYQNVNLKNMWADAEGTDANKDLVGNNVPDGQTIQCAFNLPLIPAPLRDQATWDWDDTAGKTNQPPQVGQAWQTYGDTGITWKTGQAMFSGDTGATQDYGNLPEFGAAAIRSNPLPGGATEGPVTTYYRRKFVMPPASADAITLTMRHVIDDGAIFYLNGSVLTNVRIAVGSAFNVTAANAAENNPVHTVETVTGLSTANLLLDAENNFAVEVHQSGTGSTDVLLGVELMAYITNFASGPARITMQPPAETVVTEGGSFTLTVGVAGGLPLSIKWFHDDVEIPGATGTSYTKTGVNPPDGGNYKATVSNTGGNDTSTIAHVTVNADVTSPVFLSAIGNNWLTDGTNILLSFSEALDPASVLPGKFTVTSSAGDLSVESATLQNNTNVLLVTTLRTLGVDYTATVSGVTDTSFGKNPCSGSLPVQVILDLARMDNPDQMWSFDDSGTDHGPDWAATSFIGTWPTGAQVFDVVRGGSTNRATVGGETVRTQLKLYMEPTADATNEVTTYYFQTAFNWPLYTNAATLYLRHLIDDGAVFYINGQRIAAFSFTNDPAYYTNLASASIGTAALQPGTNQPVLVNNLVHGENILSVEVHQINLTSSDVTMGVNLGFPVTAWDQPPASKPKLYVTMPDDAHVTISWLVAGSEGYSLNYTHVMDASPAWSPVTTPPVVDGDWNRVTLPVMRPEPMFFILKN